MNLNEGFALFSPVTGGVEASVARLMGERRMGVEGMATWIGGGVEGGTMSLPGLAGSEEAGSAKAGTVAESSLEAEVLF